MRRRQRPAPGGREPGGGSGPLRARSARPAGSGEAEAVRTSRFGLRAAQILTALLCGAGLFSDFLSTSPAAKQSLTEVYSPPTRIHFFDAQGAFHPRPFTYRYELSN